MAMKKILTAACVLAAASTVAAAGSGVKAAQPGGSSYIMDLRKAQEDVSSGKPETNIDLGEGISGEVQENLFAEYEKYGIVNENGVLYYHNKPIRCFADTCKIIENMNEYGGKTITYKNICTYVNWAGSIDLYTVREEIEKKAGSSLTFGKIESIEQASSIEDLASSVSAQSLMKIVEIGYGETWNSEVYKIIPFLPHEFVDNFAIQAAENGNYDGVKDLLPFLSEETVAQIADKEYDRTGTSGIRELLPYLSEESIDRLAQKAVGTDNSVEQPGDLNVHELLSFMHQKSVYLLAQKAADNGNYEELKDLVQFLSEDMVTEIVNNIYDKVGISSIHALFPFMSSESRDRLAQKAVSKGDIDSLEQMAFYISMDVLDDIARKLEKKGERTAGIAPFLSETALNEVADSAYKRAGASAIYELLPFMPEKTVDKFIQKVAAKGDYESVEKMAPFASKKVLREVAKKMQAAGISIKGIEKYLK